MTALEYLQRRSINIDTRKQPDVPYDPVNIYAIEFINYTQTILPRVPLADDADDLRLNTVEVAQTEEFFHNPL